MSQVRRQATTTRARHGSAQAGSRVVGWVERHAVAARLHAVHAGPKRRGEAVCGAEAMVRQHWPPRAADEL